MAGSSPNSMDPKPHIEIVGLIKEPHFHVAKSITEGLIQKFPREFTEPTIRPLLEFDWHAYLSNQKREMRGEVWEFSSGVMCFLDGHFIGDEGALATWAENQWGFTCIEPQASCVGEHYLKHLQSTGHRFVFMDIEIGGEAVGRLLFEMYAQRRHGTLRPSAQESEAFRPTATRSATRAPCFIAWCPTAGCKAEIFLQNGEEMEGSPSMDQPLKMRALLSPTQSGELLEWPIRALTAMAPSSTSPCRPHFGWTGLMFLLVKWLRVWTSSRE
ncbi:probable inactive peptidyl-prolyl cis-trans isomerase-like 6 isoform X2 [Dunckerocampus dactyliophorus]|uniref:probable inactive peptidyl-prolyl cis-trans isomerase-like 6 isoform X2 n=1 Tax=Dunckerocampus dactyliophorus TaxID=161453 RepID=UPI002404E330|nr:probable inactive peptidyl-prolyl cis-trans isomerase-like 6 isoform X2 [Dunckerocampus dactyliophorus]